MSQRCTLSQDFCESLCPTCPDLIGSRGLLAKCCSVPSSKLSKGNTVGGHPEVRLSPKEGKKRRKGGKEEKKGNEMEDEKRRGKRG